MSFLSKIPLWGWIAMVIAGTLFCMSYQHLGIEEVFWRIVAYGVLLLALGVWINRVKDRGAAEGEAMPKDEQS